MVRFRLLAPSVSAPRRLKVEILKLGHDGYRNIFFKWLFVFLCRIAACKHDERVRMVKRSGTRRALKQPYFGIAEERQSSLSL